MDVRACMTGILLAVDVERRLELHCVGLLRVREYDY